MMSFCSDDAYFVLRGQGEIGAGLAEMLCGQNGGVIETLDTLVYVVVGVAAALIVAYVAVKAVRFINDAVKR